MKHFTIILFLLLSVQIKAQSFTAVADTTSATDSLNSEMVFTITVTNISSSDLTLYVKRTSNDLPVDWTSSMCFNFCFSPDLDSIATTSDFGARALSPQESRELSLHVFPHTNYGTGNVTLRLGDVNNFADSLNINFTANANPVSVEGDFLPLSGFELSQNYPNPVSLKEGADANSVTTIRYSIGAVNDASSVNVNLSVYNILGKKVATLVNRAMQSGNYKAEFSANRLPAGIYFYRITAGNFTATKKMIVIR